MKIHALLAALVLAAPASSFADRKITYRSDRDGDGHYVKRTKTVPDRYYSGYRGGYAGYRGGYYGGRSYYPRYSGYSSFSRYPSYYGYGGGYGYYAQPSVVLSYSSTPRYSRSTRVEENDSLEMDVQQALRRRGYYRGAVDGDIGPGSRSAIRSYQADHGLAINGRIDSALLRSLSL